MHSRCFSCGNEVAVINCHYMCSNCGFAANWDEGSDPSSGYDKDDETLLINIIDKENNGKEDK